MLKYIVVVTRLEGLATTTIQLTVVREGGRARNQTVVGMQGPSITGQFRVECDLSVVASHFSSPSMQR
jgi:hypothetical protein